MRRVVATAAVVLLLTAIATLVAAEADVPLGGLSRDQAVALALDQVTPQSSTPVAAQWAVPGPLLVFRGGASDAVAPWNRFVWAVRITGTFGGSCGPASVRDEPLRCPTDHTATVMLDYVTGKFVMASIEP